MTLINREECLKVLAKYNIIDPDNKDEFEAGYMSGNADARYALRSAPTIECAACRLGEYVALPYDERPIDCDECYGFSNFQRRQP